MPNFRSVNVGEINPILWDSPPQISQQSPVIMFLWNILLVMTYIQTKPCLLLGQWWEFSEVGFLGVLVLFFG